MNYNNKKIYYNKLFPKLKDNKYNKLQIDYNSISYITTPFYAKQILNIITKQFKKHNLSMNSIIDCTSGVGGDTISLASIFKTVIGVEIDNIRFDMLNNNINTYNLNNIITYNDSCLNILKNLNFIQAIYIDPPWGGSTYKYYDKLRLTIDNNSIEQLVIDILQKKYLKIPPKFIILKLPKNYDIQYLFKTISFKEQIKIYLYKLKKINIIIIINDYIDNKYIIIE